LIPVAGSPAADLAAFRLGFPEVLQARQTLAGYAFKINDLMKGLEA
jgi:hypothetical protein